MDGLSSFGREKESYMIKRFKIQLQDREGSKRFLVNWILKKSVRFQVHLEKKKILEKGFGFDSKKEKMCQVLSWTRRKRNT